VYKGQPFSAGWNRQQITTIGKGKKISEAKSMATSEEWDGVIRTFDSSSKMKPTPGSTNSELFIIHAKGMVELIPRIRHFDEFKNVELSFQLGKLKCRPKGERPNMSISYGEGGYKLFIYAKDGSYSEVTYPPDEIVDAIQRHLREIV
jgi:hypothetical protein